MSSLIKQGPALALVGGYAIGLLTILLLHRLTEVFLHVYIASLIFTGPDGRIWLAEFFFPHVPGAERERLLYVGFQNGSWSTAPSQSHTQWRREFGCWEAKKREKVNVHWFLSPWLLKKHTLYPHLHWKRKISNITQTTTSSVGNTQSLVIFYIWFSISEKCPFFFYMSLHCIWYSAISELIFQINNHQ